MPPFLSKYSTSRLPTTHEFMEDMNHWIEKGTVACKEVVVPTGVNNLVEMQTMCFDNADFDTLVTNDNVGVDGWLLYTINNTCVLAMSEGYVDATVSSMSGNARVKIIRSTKSKVWALIAAWVWSQASTYEDLRTMLRRTTSRGGSAFVDNASFTMVKFKNMVAHYPYLAWTPWTCMGFRNIISMDFVLRFAGAVVQRDSTKADGDRLSAVASMIPDNYAIYADVPKWFRIYASRDLLTDFVGFPSILNEVSDPVKEMLLYWIAFGIIAEEARSKTPDNVRLHPEVYVHFVNHPHPTVALFGCNRMRLRTEVKKHYYGGMSAFKNRITSIVYDKIMTSFVEWVCGVPIGNPKHNVGYAGINGATLVRQRGYVLRPSTWLWYGAIKRPTSRQLARIARALVECSHTDEKSAIFEVHSDRMRARLSYFFFDFGCPTWLSAAIVQHLLSPTLTDQLLPLEKAAFSGMSKTVRSMIACSNSNVVQNSYNLGKYAMTSSVVDGTSFEYRNLKQLEEYVYKHGEHGVAFDMTMNKYTPLFHAALSSHCMDRVILPAHTACANDVYEHELHPGIVLYPKRHALLPAELLLAGLVASNDLPRLCGPGARDIAVRVKKLITILGRFSPKISSVIQVAAWQANNSNNRNDVRLSVNPYSNSVGYEKNKEIEALARLVRPTVKDVADMLEWPSTQIEHGSDWHKAAAEALQKKKGDVDVWDDGHLVDSATDSDTTNTALQLYLPQRHTARFSREVVGYPSYTSAVAFVVLCNRVWEGNLNALGGIKVPKEIAMLIVEILFASEFGAAPKKNTYGWPAKTQLALFSETAYEILDQF